MGIYGQGWCDGRGGSGGRVHGVGQSWADAKVFASSRPRRESILTPRRARTRHR